MTLQYMIACAVMQTMIIKNEKIQIVMKTLCRQFLNCINKLKITRRINNFKLLVEHML
jgi:hypothetical protein